MKSKILIIAIALGVYACNSPKEAGTAVPVSISVSEKNGNPMYTVALDSLKKSRLIIPLSHLLEDCMLVQMETIQDALIDPLFITVSEKYIGVSQSFVSAGGEYKLFDRSGKFLRNVGSSNLHSQGIFDDIIDDKNELIFITPNTSDKIYIYDTSGQFVKEIALPQMMRRPRMFLYDDTLTVVHTPTNNDFPGSELHKADRVMVFQFKVSDNELLNEIETPSLHFILKQTVTHGGIYVTKNTPGNFDFFLIYHHVNRNSRDTLYCIDVKNNKILPVFTMTYNSDILSVSANNSTPTDTVFRKPYFFQLNKNMIMAEIDGKEFVVADLKSKTASYIRFVNDFYGNLPVPSDSHKFSLWFRNGYFVYHITTEELKKEIKARLNERSCTDHDRKILKKTLSDLQAGTKSVMFIGKLKDDTRLW